MLQPDVFVVPPGHFVRRPGREPAWSDVKGLLLAVEVLSSSTARRDRGVKRHYYQRNGVSEYWIVDWMQRRLEVYRRADAALHLAATLYGDDMLRSPLLPGFSYRVGDLFPPPLPA